MESANKNYEKPEEVIPQTPEKDKKEGILYIMMDGSANLCTLIHLRY